MEHKVTTLGELGKITVGFQLRKGVESEPDGLHSLIQLRNVQDGTIDLSDLSRMTLTDAKDISRFVVQSGDVLLRSRGANYGAAHVTDVPRNAVALSPLFLMRPMSHVLPAYLAWFINRDEAQTFLQSTQTGTYLPAVGLAGFRSLPVIVPALDVQSQIVEIAALAKRERELINQRQNARERQIAAALERIIANKI